MKYKGEKCLPDETAEYFIPRRSKAMASLIVTDPLQDLTAAEQTAASYRRQRKRPSVNGSNVYSYTNG